MVSASKEAVDLPPAVAPPPALPGHVASLNARVSAYLVDSVILLAFVLVFFALAGFQLLAASDWGGSDPTDAAIAAFIAIISGGTVIAWSAFNIGLMRWRAQTAGMYVLGISIAGDDAPSLSTGQALLRWFALHPLLVHPFLLPLFSLLMLFSIDFAFQGGIFVVMALLLIGVSSIVVNGALILAGDERRALHDRIARTTVVHVDQP